MSKFHSQPRLSKKNRKFFMSSTSLVNVHLQKLILVAFQGRPDPIGAAPIELYRQKDQEDEDRLAMLQEKYQEIITEQGLVMAAATPIKAQINQAELAVSRKRISPLIVTSPHSILSPSYEFAQGKKPSSEEITQQMLREYRRFIEQSTPQEPRYYGPYGDIVYATITHVETRTSIENPPAHSHSILCIDQIAHKSFPLPKEATDHAFVIQAYTSSSIEDRSSCFYLAMIKRSAAPGANKTAFPGGFRDVKKDALGIEYYESTLSTAQRELKEEVGISVQYSDTNIRKDYNTSSLAGIAHLKSAEVDIQAPCVTENLGCMATSNALMTDGGETIPHSFGLKRVHTTNVVASLANAGDLVLDQAKAEGLLQASTDAKEFVMKNITEFVNLLQTLSPEEVALAFQAQEQMGIQHHQEVAAKMFLFLREQIFPNLILKKRRLNLDTLKS